jgi:uncharacterized protein (TIGR00369 family)
MTDEERVREINEFFGPKAPGLHGVEFVSMSPEAVVGRINVTEPLIAGNGFLFAPAVISLADSLCAGGVGQHRPEGATGFTTVELKANFLGTARAGEVVEGRATPAHTGRTTQVWDCIVENTTTGKTIALFRCTQLLLYPR